MNSGMLWPFGRPALGVLWSGAQCLGHFGTQHSTPGCPAQRPTCMLPGQFPAAKFTGIARNHHVQSLLKQPTEPKILYKQGRPTQMVLMRIKTHNCHERRILLNKLQLQMCRTAFHLFLLKHNAPQAPPFTKHWKTRTTQEFKGVNKKCFHCRKEIAEITEPLTTTHPAY